MILKIIFHIFIIVLLTVLTQIGGVIYFISLFIVRNVSKKKTSLIIVFSTLYLLSTFMIVPNFAPFFGREKVTESKTVKAHNFFYKLANRNYVKPKLNKIITRVGNQFEKKNNGFLLIYLDANFPFFDGFPLLPHLSHNDGEKIDISLVYEENGKITNKKPSISGYGVYEKPLEKEINQPKICKEKGYWQYDFPKYLTLGKINSEINFSNRKNKELIETILSEKEVGKLFIEPHLKNRLNLFNSKVRFHGCRAVRHDDHIHFQLK